MKTCVSFVCFVLAAQSCFAWFENGHHLIASMAMDLLPPKQQVQLRDALKAHPRFAEDFNAPADLTDSDVIHHWLIGRASYWPDIARGSSFDRPTWHYQLGATLTIGEPAGVPARPGNLPSDATLDSQELYVSQAIELCRQIWRDKSRPADQRALALCWLGHLVADSHQPCHSGSLYSTHLFPKSDRGGNLVTTKIGTNLHLFWDSQLGSPFDANSVKSQTANIFGDTELMTDAKNAALAGNGLDQATWLAESSEIGRNFVYAREVLVPLTIAENSNSPKPEMIELSEEYQTSAKTISRQRAVYAAYRLAKIWSEGL